MPTWRLRMLIVPTWERTSVLAARSSAPRCDAPFMAGSGTTEAVAEASLIQSSSHPNARLRTYPVIERNGAVWFWYHPHGTPPEFEVPVIPEWGSPEYGARWDSTFSGPFRRIRRTSWRMGSTSRT